VLLLEGMEGAGKEGGVEQDMEGGVKWFSEAGARGWARQIFVMECRFENQEMRIHMHWTARRETTYWAFIESP
jgi:hypothetical protein